MKASLFDYILSLTLLNLAWQLLRVKDIFVSVVLFIVFGLLMALAWVQLRAPDIALVEAAIGAGLTGALFLGVIGRMHSLPTSGKSSNGFPLLFLKRLRFVLFFLSMLLALTLCKSLASVREDHPSLVEEVKAEIQNSGVENPVTSVILNFRAYDTFLEITVLLLVVIAVLSLFQASSVFSSGSLVLTIFLRIMAPFMILYSFYLLWVGGHAPGGAFQAGAILGGTAILLHLGGVRLPLNGDDPLWRIVLSLGFTGFLLAGLAVMSEQRTFLEYPPSLAKSIILFIEAACALSMPAIFITLFKQCSAARIQIPIGKCKVPEAKGKDSNKYLT